MTTLKEKGMSELKKCPFCGNEAEIEENVRIYNSQKANEYDYGVSCLTEGCCSLGVDKAEDFYKDRWYDFGTKEEAIEAWNQRA